MASRDDIPPRFIGAQDFARAMGMGRSWAYEQLKLGTLRHVRVGARVLIPVSEIDRWEAMLLQGAEGGES